MNLYTRKGDDGRTGLLGGRRVSKSNLRVCAYGEVDELNAVLGMCVSAAEEDLSETLRAIQNDLFVIGGVLASEPEGKTPARIEPADVARLERWIDEACAQVPPLKHFVLPGGSERAARLHHARTVCRRAERAVVALSESGPVPDVILAYLNRLSDLLFALARRANHRDGIAETLWRPSAPG
ncbi:MAG: cob(I)yrinic acid a,c-diamide adenosyltransferase [Planctomycetota bacterium]|nr:MAG: cob(I)yrinic acid a,c-diamide adenosyltransferase [Planctomycetota bacterium]